MAAIDCGTNSLRLLIVRDGADGLRELHRVMRIVRLGEDVDRTGRLAAAALARTAAVLGQYRELIDAAGADAVRMVATSAVRDAANRVEFDAMAALTLGRPAEVITGAAEAELSFAGACAGVSGLHGPVLVTDIGGGSTELVRGQPDPVRVDAAVSLDVGSVRLTERHVRSDPPAAVEVEAIRADVTAALRAADPGARGAEAGEHGHPPLPAHPGDRLIGVAGTVTTLAALALRLERYDSARVHGAVLSRAQIDVAVDELLGMDRAARSATGVIHPGRVDVIAAGAVILATLMSYLDIARITISEHDILDGIALGLLA